MKYTNYGLVAINAVKTISKFSSPREAWESVCLDYYFGSTSSQHKGCPKDTFLGMCEEGYIKGIVKGDYTRSKLNKQYAIDAIKFLKEKGESDFSPSDLWKHLKLGEKKHNNQMDVVLALWHENYIV